MSFTSTGTLRYSPKLLGKSSAKWWLVVDCDKTLGDYYRHLYWLARHRLERMQRPAWCEHITVIRDEEPPVVKQTLWSKYAGQEVVFDYNPTIATNGEYWWLDVCCPKLLDIREELGLPRQPEIPLHLSIGHHKDATQ